MGYIWLMASFTRTSEESELDSAMIKKVGQSKDRPNYLIALFLASCMSVVGFVLFVVGLLTGIFLTVHSRPYGNGVVGYGSFFDRHEYAFIGLPLISSSLTFGLPFAAIGSYMSVRLRSMRGSVH